MCTHQERLSKRSNGYCVWVYNEYRMSGKESIALVVAAAAAAMVVVVTQSTGDFNIVIVNEPKSFKFSFGLVQFVSNCIPSHLHNTLALLFFF